MTRKFPPANFGSTGDEMTSVSPEDYIATGKKIVEWARDPKSRPTSLAAFNAAIGDHYKLPPSVQAVAFVQGSPELFIIRLPEVNQLDESLGVVGSGGYTPPPVVKLIADNPENLAATDIFYARVADYTMRQCR